MTLVRTGVPLVTPRVNWGRFIADCPMCPGGVIADGRTFHVCVSCHEPFEIIYPPQQTMTAVARLLMLRPDVTTRNWEGETIHDLLIENAVHGILDNLGPGPVLGWDDLNGITMDALPARPQLRAVSA